MHFMNFYEGNLLSLRKLAYVQLNVFESLS